MTQNRKTKTLTFVKTSCSEYDSLYFRDILKTIVDIAQKQLIDFKGMILLASPGRNLLVFRAGFGLSENDTDIIKRNRFHLSVPRYTGVFSDVFLNGRSVLVNRIDQHKDTLPVPTLTFVEKIGVNSFICCPITHGTNHLGVFSVTTTDQKKDLLQKDLILLKNLAFITGLALSNQSLAFSTPESRTNMITALAACLTTHDLLSAEHVRRVSDYALGICRELGLSQGFQDVIQVAALLHDYGKKNIPDYLLKKRERLTCKEYERVKTHAAKTRVSLEKLNFTGKFKRIPTIAGSHHERLDGCGYPLGLKGSKIPLGARIIAVADFFDAITSTRHYREPMEINQALSLLYKESHTHFESAIVEAFASYYLKGHPQADPMENRLAV